MLEIQTNQSFGLKATSIGQFMPQSKLLFLFLIEKVPGNESSWNYLCGLMEKCEDCLKVETRQKVREFCNNLLQSLQDEKPPIYLLATLVDVNKADSFDTDNTVQVKYKFCYLF